MSTVAKVIEELWHGPIYELEAKLQTAEANYSKAKHWLEIQRWHLHVNVLRSVLAKRKLEASR